MCCGAGAADVYSCAEMGFNNRSITYDNLIVARCKRIISKSSRIYSGCKLVGVVPRIISKKRVVTSCGIGTPRISPEECVEISCGSGVPCIHSEKRVVISCGIGVPCPSPEKRVGISSGAGAPRISPEECVVISSGVGIPCIHSDKRVVTSCGVVIPHIHSEKRVGKSSGVGSSSLSPEKRVGTDIPPSHLIYYIPGRIGHYLYRGDRTSNRFNRNNNRTVKITCRCDLKNSGSSGCRTPCACR